MIWLYACIMAMTLMVLGVSDEVVFNDWLIALLTDDDAFLLMNVIFVMMSVVIIGIKSLDYHHKFAHWLAKLGVWVGYGVLICLFVVRVMSADASFKTQSPDRRYLVSATVHLDEIGDGVYDEIAGTAYRQVATLSEVKPVVSTSKSLKLPNPFYDENTIAPIDTPTDLSHLNGIRVLMSAQPNFGDFDKNSIQYLQQLNAGKTATVQLLITPLSEQSAAFDQTKWLKSRHIHANARLLSVGQIEDFDDGSISLSLQRLRQNFREHFYQEWQTLDLQSQQVKAVNLSLLTGDRALIDKSTKELYQLAGISHLLAISGTHVLFLAVVLAMFATKVMDYLCPHCYQTISRWQIRLLIMMGAGMLYAMFTGFDVPAVRTVYMLMAMWLARLFVLPIKQVTILLSVAVLMIWLDPFVVWQAGFWLSFVAVLILMRHQMAEEMLAQEEPMARRWLGQFWRLCRLQFWLFLMMMPLSILLFGKVSIWGLFVNLFAISFFGLLIVPINLLAGLVYVLLPALAQMLWQISFWLLLALHWLLEIGLSTHLGGLGVWLYAPFGFLGIVFAMMMVALLLLPKVLPKSMLILPILAMMLLSYQHEWQDEFVLENLASHDPKVSQKLLQYRQQNHQYQWLVLADFGAKKLGQRHIDGVIHALKRQGIYRLDGVIVQTASPLFIPMVDALHEQFAIHRYWQAGRHQSGEVYHQPCIAGLHWQGEGLQIQALTGWRQIDDENVWDCELQIIANQPLKMMDMEQMSDLSESAGGTQLMMSAAKPMAWELWQRLCPDAHQVFEGFANHQKIWLSSPYVIENEQILQQYQPQKVLH